MMIFGERSAKPTDFDVENILWPERGVTNDVSVGIKPY